MSVSKSLHLRSFPDPAFALGAMVALTTSTLNRLRDVWVERQARAFGARRKPLLPGYWAKGCSVLQPLCLAYHVIEGRAPRETSQLVRGE